jgi:alanine racemase
VTPTRPTIAEVNLAAIAHNLKGVREVVGRSTKVMAIVKANAYGHGLTEVARAIERSVDCFGVAFAEEGVRLREEGIRKPITVLTLAGGRQADLVVDYRLEPTVCMPAEISVFERLAGRKKKSVSVHLKVETGMNRIGAQQPKLREIAQALGSSRRVKLKGVFTHFATADEQNKEYSRWQLHKFSDALEFLRREGIEAELTHCANSAAILDLPESYFQLVRPGIMLYGYYPSHHVSPRIPLRPAMRLVSHVALVKWIEAGESVSYGRRFIAKKRTKIATVPIGYADGFSRLLTGKAWALINGTKHPIVGSVCMDQLMVDVGTNGVEAGDEVVLIGKQVDQTIDAWQLADRLGTIPYEICCSISARVPRVYVRS